MVDIMSVQTVDIEIYKKMTEPTRSKIDCESESNEQTFRRLQKHKDVILIACKTLSDCLVCPLKVVSCNGDVSCSISNAWCSTVRNDQTGLLFSDIFNLELLSKFLESVTLPDVTQTRMHGLQLTLQKLADFFDSYEDVETNLKDHKDYELSEIEWTGLFTTHILKKLTTGSYIIISDTGFPRVNLCVCGCKEVLSYGDTSMGNEAVWHGNVDIIVGRVSVAISTAEDESEDDDGSISSFDMKSEKLENRRHQIISKAIMCACTLRGLIPTIEVTRRDFKVFLYDLKSDLLVETMEFDLLKPDLPVSSILALWLVLNHTVFGMGVCPEFQEEGLCSGFKTFVKEKHKLEIYENEMRLFGCRCKKDHTTLPPLREFYTKEKLSALQILRRKQEPS